MEPLLRHTVTLFACIFGFIFWNELVILPFQMLDPFTTGLMSQQEQNRRSWVNLPLVGINFLFMAGGAYSAIGLYDSSFEEEAQRRNEDFKLGFKALCSSVHAMKEVAEMMATDFIGKIGGRRRGGKENG